MELNPKTINEILGLYEKYCQVMKLDNRPVLTLNISEYKLAVKGIDKKPQSEKYLGKIFGQCMHQNSKIGNNDIIYLNSAKFIALLGLHEYSKEIEIIKKRKYTYKIRRQLGHLEETLIHELLHAKYPNMRHGEHFKDTIRYYYSKGNEYISKNISDNQ